jgi:hypothetical protein
MKKVQIEIYDLEIKQGECMGETYLDNILISISEKQLNKLLSYTNGYIRISINEI